MVTRVPSWANKGVTLKLDDVVKRSKFDLSDFTTQSIESCKFKDQPCFLPQQDSFYILLYNKDLFDKAGVAYPGTTLKWEDIPVVAKKMTRDTSGDGKLDEWGFWAPSGDKQWISALWINGASYMDEKATRSTLDRPEAVAAATRSGASHGTVTLLISHRFSTVRMADLIVVLDQGRVREAGSHAELVASGGLYAELYALQARAYR